MTEILSTNLSRTSLWILAGAALLLCGSGCSSLQTLGLPLSSPQHRLMRTTRNIANAQNQAALIPKELDKGVLAEYRVEPGDVLFVEADDFDDPIRLPGQQTVMPDGSISLGRFGQVQVAGQTLDEIQIAVRDAIKTKSSNQDVSKVNVRMVNWESKVFYVLGEVGSPGAYPITGNETVLDAIISAGELTRSANRQKIILARPSLPDECRIVLPICYRHIVQLGDTSTNYQLQPGDRVYVASMGLFDDLIQTLLRRRGEICPRCSSCQQGCQPGRADSRLIPSYSANPLDNRP